MKSLNCVSLAEYIQAIEGSAREYQRCQDYLRVTISRFFRDREVWSLLQNRILPKLIKEWPKGLKVWSGGCSCGEEPYSLAIIWSMLGNPADIHILATDADPRCLERAKQGIYPQSSLKELPVDIVANCFSMTEDRWYTIKPFLQENIQWQRHDLLEQPPKGPFQIIFLRNNLFTYYSNTVAAERLESIVEQLLPGGILIIGKHERLPMLKATFKQDSCRCIYQKLVQ
ncbi:MAG: CheR family methyltransferase [Desulfocapsaceae bacterium]|nr:CheR family methyltransferase [Desulfocapsaceae bacterium]